MYRDHHGYHILVSLNIMLVLLVMRLGKLVFIALKKLLSLGIQNRLFKKSKKTIIMVQPIAKEYMSASVKTTQLFMPLITTS